jgi:hypothetical protein
MTTPFELLKLAAATWLISYMISNTHGPFGFFASIREYLPLGGLTSCIICLSIWVVIGLRLLNVEAVTDAFAVAGVALMLHSFTGWRMNI